MTALHRIGYIGNFRRPWCTEVHVKGALESLGHSVVPWQEDKVDWATLANVAVEQGVDFVLWTRTWHLPSTNGTTWEQQLRTLAELERAGIPTVGYHLDRWWGLDREHQVRDEPFFRCTVMCTADGGHDTEWAKAGVTHWWFPPGVYGAEAVLPGRPRPEWQRDVGFVGSWERYHAEWRYRMELVQWLRTQFDRHGKLLLLPQGGAPVRGQDLNDAYASVRVVVGDSCLAGGITRYWSDRVPETIGRGGFLIHPRVDGIEEHYTDGEHLALYDLGDWTTLRQLIHVYSTDHEERARVVAAGRAHVLEHHTYETRMAQLIERLHDGWVSAPDTQAGRRRVFGRGGMNAVFDMREGTSDALVVNEVWRLDTYGLDPADVAGRVVLDLGANVGAFTVWACTAGALRVHAYEPEASNAAACWANVEANAYTDRVVLREAAVAGADGVVELVYDDKGLASTSTRPTRRKGGTGVVPAHGATQVLTDALLHGVPLVVKLDVEGAESDIVCTLADRLPEAFSAIERMVMEFHPPVSNDPRSRTETFGAMVTALAEHGHVTILGRPSVGGMLHWRRY